MKNDKPPCKTCKHGEMKHNKSGRCMLRECKCEGYK